MAWSYRKRIKIIPGVHLNFSKSGITTSIGVRGASLTFGKSGTYVNTSIPGTGLYNRQKLSGSSYNPTPTSYNRIEQYQEDNIFSADVHSITSPNMQGIKETILLAHEQRNDLKKDLTKVKSSLGYSNIKLALSYLLLYGLIKKSIAENIKIDISSQRNAVNQLREQIDNCCVDLNIDFDSVIESKYNAVISTFKKLMTSNVIWDVTSAHYQDRVVARSSASTIIKKREVKFSLQALPDIKSNFEVLHWQNANGVDLYFYPSFIVMYSSRTSFALISINELNFYYSYVGFTETGTVPRDSKVIDRTWAKVNKNGTPDKRFKGNYQIPVVKYGVIGLKTSTGLNEEYEFSNYEFTEEFGNAFKEYQATIKTLRNNN